MLRTSAYAVALAAALTVSLLQAAPVSQTATAAPAGRFLVGAAVEDISPSDALIASRQLYLGGYGLGSGSVAGQPIYRGRAATGVMTVGRPSVRAIAIGDGGGGMAVFTDLDNQGTFAALKPNYQTGAERPYGLDAIRADASRETGVPMRAIVVSSDHSHAGQDLTGAWGFVPDSYLAFVHDQAVKAITEAVLGMRPAEVKEGAVDTPSPCDGRGDNILNNQFDCSEPPENRVDTELRVLQARDAAGGAPIVTLVNFAAHATVGGSSNTLVSADWPGALAEQLERTYGGIGMTLVADVGRSQPNRSACSAAELASGAYAVDTRNPATSCSMSKYAAEVKAYGGLALKAARPLPWRAASVRAASFFIREPATNATLFGLNYAGDPAGAPIARQIVPPYLAGTTLGTWVSAVRIGDLLVTTNPGEAYPNLRDGVRQAVGGARRYWTIGLADDQLGYLVAPFPEAYPIVLAHAAQGNDNYLFNVSHTIGDHVMCRQIALAAGLGFSAAVPARCAAWGSEPNTAGPDGSPPPA